MDVRHSYCASIVKLKQNLSVLHVNWQQFEQVLLACSVSCLVSNELIMCYYTDKQGLIYNQQDQHSTGSFQQAEVQPLQLRAASFCKASPTKWGSIWNPGVKK
jgi:hypothetical protein